jgi:cobalt-precorrin-5B (C1)-methyltransferase
MLRDPVTDFTYPDEWTRKCTDPQLLEEVRKGLAVLTAQGVVLRRGYTTGTTAAAAGKAAVLSLAGDIDAVDVVTRSGVPVRVAVNASNGKAECRKYPGDYPSDATAGVLFAARAELRPAGIEIVAGEGIGRFVRDTSRNKKGDAAISPAAMEVIVRSVEEALRSVGGKGAHVELSVPEGREIGARTLNPRMGVENGISVLGTTGLVEPWDDHLEESNLERIAGARRVVLTTGRVGLRFSRMLFPEHEVVLVGARMEKAVEAAKGEVILCGLPALILKFVDPDILARTGCGTIEQLSMTEEWGPAVKEAMRRSKRERPNLRVVILDRSGNVLEDSG